MNSSSNGSNVVVKDARLNENLVYVVEEAIKEAGFNSALKPGEKVLINPNLVAVPPERKSGATTLVEVTEAVALHVHSKGARPIIADSAAVGINTEDVIQITGYDSLRNKGFEVRDLKKDHIVKMGEFEIYKTAYEADTIISLPVMKTHDQFEVSLGTKNLKGLLPDNLRKAFHRRYNLAKALASFLQTLASRKKILAVMDGLVALEGRGPVFGNPIDVGLILASKDMVALDSIAAMIMGVREKELFLEQESAYRGLGTLKREKIEISGDYTFDLLPRINFDRGKNLKIEADNFEIFFSEKTCTGCKNTLISCLQVIKEAKVEYILEGKKIFAGETSQHIEKNIEKIINPGDDVIMIGSCLFGKENKNRIKKANITLVPGCPPEINDVLKNLQFF